MKVLCAIFDDYAPSQPILYDHDDHKGSPKNPAVETWWSLAESFFKKVLLEVLHGLEQAAIRPVAHAF